MSSARLSHVVKHNKDTFLKLGFYSVLLFVVGLGSFFLARRAWGDTVG